MACKLATCEKIRWQMWSLDSNSILASDCKQLDCKQRAARGEGSRKIFLPPPTVAQEYWGLPPKAVSLSTGSQRANAQDWMKSNLTENVTRWLQQLMT